MDLYKNLLGKTPMAIKKIKNNKDLIDYFLFYFDLSFGDSFSVEEVKNLPKLLTDYLNKVDSTFVKKDEFEKKWWILIAIYLKMLYHNKVGTFFSEQAIDVVIGSIGDMPMSKVIKDVALVNNVNVLKDGVNPLVVRPSLVDINLVEDYNPVFHAVIQTREEVMTILEKKIPRSKIKINRLEEYLRYSSFKNMKNISLNLFDIMSFAILRNFEELFEGFDVEDENDQKFIIDSFCSTLLDFFNIFICDISIVKRVATSITNIVIPVCFSD